MPALGAVLSPQAAHRLDWLGAGALAARLQEPPIKAVNSSRPLFHTQELG